MLQTLSRLPAIALALIALLSLFSYPAAVSAQTSAAGSTWVEIEDSRTVHNAINDARLIDVSATSTTPNKSLLSFDMSAGGSSDVRITKIPFSFVVTGAEHADDTLSKVHLVRDGVRIATETVPANQDRVVFDDLVLTLPRNTTSVFQVRGDFLPTSGPLDDGDTIAVKITEAETDSSDFDPKDSAGTRLPDGDVSGDAYSKPHAVYADGIRVRLVSAKSATVGNSIRSGRYEIKYEVIATKTDLYLPASIAPTSGAGFQFESKSSTGASSTIPYSASLTSDAPRESGNFIVRKGEKKAFSAVVTLTPTVKGFYGVEGVAINYRSAPTAQRKAFEPTTSFKAPFLSLDPAAGANPVVTLTSEPTSTVAKPTLYGSAQNTPTVDLVLDPSDERFDEYSAYGIPVIDGKWRHTLLTPMPAGSYRSEVESTASPKARAGRNLTITLPVRGTYKLFSDRNDEEEEALNFSITDFTKAEATEHCRAYSANHRYNLVRCTYNGNQIFFAPGE